MSQSSSSGGDLSYSGSQDGSSLGSFPVSESTVSVSNMSSFHQPPQKHVEAHPEGTYIIQCSSEFSLLNSGVRDRFDGTIRVSKETLSIVSPILKAMFIDGRWAEGNKSGGITYIECPFTFEAMVPLMLIIHYKQEAYMLAKQQYGLEISIGILEEIFVALDYYGIDAKSLRFDDRLRLVTKEKINAFLADTGLDNAESHSDKMEICSDKYYVTTALQIYTISSLMKRDDLANSVAIFLILGTDGVNNRGYIGISGQRYLSGYVPMPVYKQLANIRQNLIKSIYEAFQTKYNSVFQLSAAGICSCSQHKNNAAGSGPILPGEHCDRESHERCVQANKARLASFKGYGGFETVDEALKSASVCRLYNILKDITEEVDATRRRPPHAKWAEHCNLLGQVLDKVDTILKEFIDDEDGRESTHFSMPHIKTLEEEDDDDFSFL